MNAIDELRYDKAVLEREMERLLAEFKAKYDVKVEEISLDEIYRGNEIIHVRVYVTVKI